MSEQAPNLAELQPLVVETLAAATYFTAAQVSVIEDNGTKKKTIERQLRDRGACVVVMPVLIGRRRDQSGQMTLFDFQILVKVMTNQEQNGRKATAGNVAGANLNIYTMVKTCVETLCRSPRHPGGEFFRIAEDAITLSSFDEGLWSYDLLFTKEAVI